MKCGYNIDADWISTSRKRKRETVGGSGGRTNLLLYSGSHKDLMQVIFRLCIFLLYPDAGGGRTYMLSACHSNGVTRTDKHTA